MIGYFKVLDLGESGVRAGLVLQGRQNEEHSVAGNRGGRAIKQKLRQILNLPNLSDAAADRALRTLQFKANANSAPLADDAEFEGDEKVKHKIPGPSRTEATEIMFNDASAPDETIPALLTRLLGRVDDSTKSLVLNSVVVGGGLASVRSRCINISI